MKISAIQPLISAKKGKIFNTSWNILAPPRIPNRLRMNRYLEIFSDHVLFMARLICKPEGLVYKDFLVFLFAGGFHYSEPQSIICCSENAQKATVSNEFSKTMSLKIEAAGGSPLTFHNSI